VAVASGLWELDSRFSRESKITAMVEAAMNTAYSPKNQSIPIEVDVGKTLTMDTVSPRIAACLFISFSESLGVWRRNSL
jgi:hypothetical protein